MIFPNAIKKKGLASYAHHTMPNEDTFHPFHHLIFLWYTFSKCVNQMNPDGLTVLKQKRSENTLLVMTALVLVM